MYNFIQIVNFFFDIWKGLFVARILLSWLPIDRSHPVIDWICKLTEPLLVPLRRILPSVGAGGVYFDLSPLAAWIALDLVQLVVMNVILYGVLP
ncbi:MAG: YggT family protein [Firmicutes bacterium]|nr:YggT family protein [Bacillota bacterium]